MGRDLSEIIRGLLGRTCGSALHDRVKAEVSARQPCADQQMAVLPPVKPGSVVVAAASSHPASASSEDVCIVPILIRFAAVGRRPPCCGR